MGKAKYVERVERQMEELERQHKIVTAQVLKEARGELARARTLRNEAEAIVRDMEANLNKGITSNTGKIEGLEKKYNEIFSIAQGMHQNIARFEEWEEFRDGHCGCYLSEYPDQYKEHKGCKFPPEYRKNMGQRDLMAEDLKKLKILHDDLLDDWDPEVMELLGHVHLGKQLPLVPVITLFECQCGVVIEFPDYDGGRVGPCPKCKQRVWHNEGPKPEMNK